MHPILPLIPALCLSFAPVFQDAPPAAAKTWTQEELERVSNEIKADIEKMRGMEFKRPVKVQVADKKAFLDYARKRQELTESPQRRVRDEAIAKMLGVVPADMDLQATLEKLLEEQVGGFYDPGSDTFFLMEAFGGDLAKIILAHELTHALDDQHFDLDGTLEHLGEQTDREFAYMAVVEGSGTSAMNQWTIQRLASIDKKALLASQDLGTKGLAEAPALLWKPLIAAYLRGEGFLVRVPSMNLAMKAAKVEDITSAFENPPRSSEQILHPAKYWNQDERDEPRKVEFDTSKLPEGWKVLGEDTLGELYLGLMTTPTEERKGLDAKNPLAVLGIKYTNPAAEGWGGDRALLLEKGDARVLILVTVWDTPKDAQEFIGAAESVLVPKAETGEVGAAGRFDRTIERPGQEDEIVVRVCSGVASKDAPRVGWRVSPPAKDDVK
ncbi:MAG: hypothetical protein ACKVXR_05035 [Planctomycetota bacterium]